MKIQCSNCGQSIPENYTVCDGCSHIVTNDPEKLQVDKKYYASLQTGKENGTGTAMTSIFPSKRNILIVSTIIVTAVSFMLSSSFLNKKRGLPKQSDQKLNAATVFNTDERKEVKVVILKSGKTYYARKIEYFGNFANITSRDGSMRQVPKDKISQVSTAILEKQSSRN